MRSMIEDTKILWASAPANYTGAANTINYVSLKNYDRLTAVIATGAWAGGTAAVTVNEATSVAGGSAQALAFTAYWHDESTSGTLVKTTCSDTFNLDTANKVYVLEIEASSLSEGFDCVGVAVASPGANDDLYSITYVLSGGRHKAATPPSAEID